jgi:hypothetical protein
MISSVSNLVLSWKNKVHTNALWSCLASQILHVQTFQRFNQVSNRSEPEAAELEAAVVPELPADADPPEELFGFVPEAAPLQEQTVLAMVCNNPLARSIL